MSESTPPQCSSPLPMSSPAPPSPPRPGVCTALYLLDQPRTRWLLRPGTWAPAALVLLALHRGQLPFALSATTAATGHASLLHMLADLFSPSSTRSLSPQARHCVISSPRSSGLCC